jgi:hypothetical protein
MDELIARLVADVGIDRSAAEQAVGIILDFLVKEGPADKVQPLLGRLPGAVSFLTNSAGARDGGVMDGMLDGMLGGMMGAGMRMMSAGLSMTEAQNAARTMLTYAREKAGDEVISEVGAAIPGLAQFV